MQQSLESRLKVQIIQNHSMIKYQQNYNHSKYKGIMYNIKIYPIGLKLQLSLSENFSQTKNQHQMRLSANCTGIIFNITKKKHKRLQVK